MLQKSRITRKYGGAFVVKRSDLSPEELQQVKSINRRTLAYIIVLLLTYVGVSLLIS
ncbi:hypothetical protein ACE38W_03620 [Chitinophaga sp. Hz27]|uniref:hypothetical protein n=1 Tax=Chitinophaga sp. Hz27 TaxID=3347169 RepID=UPI0035DDEA81